MNQEAALADLIEDIQIAAIKLGWTNVDDSTLRKLIKEWNGSKGEIIAYGVSKKDGNFKVVTKDPRGEYRLCRYFTIAGEWQVSVDADGDAEKVICRLLQ